MLMLCWTKKDNSPRHSPDWTNYSKDSRESYKQMLINQDFFRSVWSVFGLDNRINWQDALVPDDWHVCQISIDHEPKGKARISHSP